MEAWLALVAEPMLPLDGSGCARSHFFGELPHSTEKLKMPGAAICLDWYGELHNKIRGG